MSLPTILAAIAVALIISSIVAIAGYYLQTRLRRLEELEGERFAPILANVEIVGKVVGVVRTYGETTHTKERTS